MTLTIRLVLLLLFLDEVTVGAWNQFLPASFYDNFPTVDLTPPFSEHYARDFGGASLGIAVVLLIALVKPRTHYVIPAGLAFSVFAVPHFVFHLTHMDMADPGQQVFLTVANSLVVVLGPLAITLAVVRDTRASQRGASPG
jgi:hypothetical protein